MLTVSNNQIVKQFEMGGMQSCYGGSAFFGFHSANTSAEWNLEVVLEGYDTSRFSSAGSGPLSLLHGNNPQAAGDPTFTRWLPLAFSPVLSSQPFRTKEGPLQPPWGNVQCAYSIALRKEPAPPLPVNFDLFGTGLIYQASNGAVYTNTLEGRPSHSITDVNGDRLVYLDPGMIPFGNIYSTLVSLPGGGFELQNAGPPGAIRERGHYTYTFGALTGDPPTARLLAIRDPFGNQHTLDWRATGLIVIDSSSGRRLVFNGNPANYFTSVDAPVDGGGNHTRIVLTFDGSGHLTQLQIKDGLTQAVLRTDAFGYGGPTGDCVVSVQRNGRTASYTFVNTGAKDLFGKLLPRVSTATFGRAGDTSSAYDGGSVQATYIFKYGPVEKGPGNFGVDVRTHSVTAPYNNKTTLVYFPLFGPLTYYSITAPDFSGAPANSNKWQVLFSPDVRKPTAITLTDPFSLQ